MIPTRKFRNSVEILEQRIAPAGLINEAGFKFAPGGSTTLLHAGEGLTTGVGAGSGTYLLYVEKGDALVFTTDFNLNGVVDFNEITGIAAGDGLRLISFVDIHGDIVTNLRTDTTLSDSDNDPSNDPASLRGDGRVLLNNTIEKIELRSVQASDFAINGQTDFDGDGEVDEAYLQQRLALSSYSIFGNVLAGKGFGASDGGLIINTDGFALQEQTFTPGNTSPDLYFITKPEIGSIKTGTAASGQYFSFGVSKTDNVQGRLSNFIPANGEHGGDIINVRASSAAAKFNIGSLEAGNGGVGGRGGNIIDVQLNGDTTGGYRIIAGDGGRGPTGGDGGAITNFSDLGSITSEVVFKTGTGGQGTTGAGGNAGDAVFGTMKLSGGVQIILGDGGAGFNVGGNGASLGKATIVTPEGNVPYGVNFMGLARDPGQSFTSTPIDDIGTTIPVDFNQDGFGDYVYSTNDPGQLVVTLANPDALPLSDPFSFGLDEVGQPIYHRIFLNGPSNAKALVVADFNGDGHQDIAVSSMDDGNMGGVMVFLSKFEDLNADGILTPVEDVNQNGINDFLGFESPIHSALPTLFSGAVENSLANIFGFRRAAMNVSDIAAGDFNGDGFTDLAVVASYYKGGNNYNTYQKIIFMYADVEDGKPTGQFYADFGTKAAPGVPAAPRYPVYNPGTPTAQGDPGDVLIEATKLAAGSPYDVIVSSTKRVFIAGIGCNFLEVEEFPDATIAPAVIGEMIFDRVDTNRNLRQGNNANVAMQAVTLRDIIVTDYNGDGFADVVVLADSPAGFMVAGIGDGLGTFTLTTDVSAPNDDASVDNGQNWGIYFGDGGNNAPQSGFGVGTSIVGIRATDADGDGLYNDILAMNYSFGNIVYMNAVGLTGGSVNNQGAQVLDGALSTYVAGRDDSIVAFDTVVGDVTARTAIYGAIWPTKTAGDQEIEFPNLGLTGIFNPITNNSVNIFAGDGGNALVGKGGTGGFIGGKLGTETITTNGVSTTDALGSIAITLPDNRAYAGVVKLYGGFGGNGFTTGGNGGNVGGISVRFANPQDGVTIHTSVALIGGDGGFGVSGAGGNGGDVSSNSIEGGEYFGGGDGGRGLTGGNGGSVIGNGRKEYFDNFDLFVEVVAGNGGSGIKKGGNGGSVTNFSPEFVGLVGNSGGFYVVHGGDAGSAVLGAGGNGGSVTNSAPRTGDNKLAGEIFVTAGNGGLGTVGGNGGSVTNFINKPSGDLPSIVSFLGGDGGVGTVGNGGAGGSVTNVTTPSSGVVTDLALRGSGYTFNRVIAGLGGLSASGKGGAGGDVSGIDVTASEGPFAVVAGAGGAGLYSGGAGGSVTGSTVTIGDTALAKVLVIAGAGGGGYAFIPNSLDSSPNQAQKQFGGKVGVGGAGGNITGFTQELAIEARVDLIAGNGGNTVNYGTVADQKTFVGKGGSITNTRVTGTIGNMDTTTPIKAYNDRDFDGHTDQTMAQFVQETFRLGRLDALLQAPYLDDSIGNVGAVVGAAGRLKAVETSPGSFSTQAALFSTNGSFQNITARGLMSAVAGDVNSIAAIQIASGLKIGYGTAPNFTPGTIGADKLPTIGVPFDYLDQNGDERTEPELGFRLVDGALVYRKTTDTGLGSRAYQR